MYDHITAEKVETDYLMRLIDEFSEVRDTKTLKYESKCESIVAQTSDDQVKSNTHKQYRNKLMNASSENFFIVETPLPVFYTPKRTKTDLLSTRK